MKLVATGRVIRLAGWALPFLAVLYCAPSVARAGCGDYVVTRGTHAAPMAEQHTPDMPSPADPHKPCSGPNCSRGPTVPPLAPITVAPPAPQEWGWVGGVPVVAPTGRAALLFDSSLSQPIRLVSSIYHPPRSAA